MNRFLYTFLIILIAACSKKDSVVFISNNNTSNSNQKTIEVASSGIEDFYTPNGILHVATEIITNSTGKKLYKIYYPSNLNDVYPLITWGNGTSATPKNYDSLLTHLASWGFIVIDSYSTQTGSGKAILDAAKYMVAQNKNSGSIFYQKTDVTRIGAAGHSQGATGVINAHTKYAWGKNNIKALITVALPSLALSDAKDKYNVKLITCPIFFISGTKDGLISSLSTNKKAYDNLKAGLPAAMALRVGAGHNAIQTGNTERGYLTAWMSYQLHGYNYAKGAFAGPGAEILNNANWKNAAVKNTE